MKHKLKMMLRGAWARFLFHTGAWKLVDRVMPRRLVILAGHCVEHPPCNGFLPRDMKISRQKLERVLRWLGERFELCTVGDAVQKLERGKGKSLVALSMDDGYQDNVEVLLPLLQGLGVPATVFLESRPLAERKINWAHKYFWLLRKLSAEQLVTQYLAESTDPELGERLQRVLEVGRDVPYHLKRHLKYDADQHERDRVVDLLFERHGGDERALCDALYLSWDDARRLAEAGIELGGHTVHHYVLSALGPQEQIFEVNDGRAVLERELGTEISTFAYPFGRSWDFDDYSCQAVRDAGFRAAVTTHAGTNRAGGDPVRLKRWMIDEDVELHLLAAEACGGFDLLRVFGLDLSE